MSISSRDLLVSDGETRTNSEIAAALEKANGNLSEAAAHLGIKRHVLAGHVERVEALRLYHLDFLEKAIDKAQSNVFKAVENGDYGASQFLLTTLGKDRGFSTKQEMTLAKTVDLNDLSEEQLIARIDELIPQVEALRGNVITAEPGNSGTAENSIVPFEERLRRDEGYRSEADLREVAKAAKQNATTRTR